MESWIESGIEYAGKIVSLRTGTVRLDDGTEAFREVIEHPGGVGVVPLLGDSVVLIRQYRVAIDKSILEIPAGKLEGDESPETRGRLELEEETGYRAGHMEPIGHFYPSCGILAEKLHLFMATDLEKTEQNLEPDERIEIVEMPLAEARQRLERHEFEDGKTIIGLWAALREVNDK